MVKTGRMSNKINRRKFNLKLIGDIILDQKTKSRIRKIRKKILTSLND